MKTFFLGVWSVIRRELGIMRTDSNIIMVLFVGPLVYTLIFGLVYEKSRVYRVPIVVVDEDRSESSRAIVRSLDAGESVAVADVISPADDLPGRFMREECWAAVVIPGDFERSVKRGDPAQLLMLTNASNIITGNYAQRGVQGVLATASGSVAVDRMMRGGALRSAALAAYTPVSLQTRVLFNPASNYANFIIPLLLMLLIHQVVILGCGMSWARDAAAGPVPGGGQYTPSRIFIGKSAPYIFMTMFWMAVGVLGTHTWLAIPFGGGIVGILLLGILAGTCLVTIGSLLGTLIRSKVGVVQMVFFTSMPLVLVSGGSWPLEAMPKGLQIFSLLLPSTHMMEIYRRMSLESAGWGILWPSYLRLALIAAGLLLLRRVVGARQRSGDPAGGV